MLQATSAHMRMHPRKPYPQLWGDLINRHQQPPTPWSSRCRRDRPRWRAEGDTLAVTKLDRLARSTLDMPTIITRLGERGVKFVSQAEPWANTQAHVDGDGGNCRVRARPYS